MGDIEIALQGPLKQAVNKYDELRRSDIDI